VEANFREIALQVRKQQLVLEAKKGEIVRHVLDADTQLKESDQGRSFYAFWEFLISGQKQDELQLLLHRIYDLSEWHALEPSQQLRLRRLKWSLLEAASRISESNQQLGERLRKLLDDQKIAEARRVMALATEIKQLAVSVVESPPADKDFYYLEGMPDLDMPMDRPLWSPPVRHNFAQIEPEVGELDLTTTNLEALFAQFYVDEGRLRRQVAILLQQGDRVTLGAVVARYPLEKGLAELITYVALASRDDVHEIDDNSWEEVALTAGGRLVRLPLVTFCKAYE
jgi:hypothetical protein